MNLTSRRLVGRSREGGCRRRHRAVLARRHALLRHTDIAQAVEWFLSAARKGTDPRNSRWDSCATLALASRRTMPKRWRVSGRCARQRCAQRTVGEFYRKGAARSPPMPPKPCGGSDGRGGDDLRAQYLLGQMYFDGAGVARDYVSAHVTVYRGRRTGSLVDNRKQIDRAQNIAAARMTPEQVARPRRDASWQPSSQSE